jgi:hypothetical protein
MDGGDTIGARRRTDGAMERVLPDGSTRPLTGDTDWPRLLTMTDDEIEANATADPDNPPLSPEELARMRPASVQGDRRVIPSP